MTMTPGNYLEHAAAELSSLMPGVFDVNKHDVLSVALKAPRFLIPDGGKILDFNPKYLTLPLRLPYPCIVLEFLEPRLYGPRNNPRRVILIAMERVVSTGLVIDVDRIDTWETARGLQSGRLETWRFSEYKLCLSDHFLLWPNAKTKEKWPEGEVIAPWRDWVVDRTAMTSVGVWVQNALTGEIVDDVRLAGAKYNASEIFLKTDEQLLGLLLALQCSNVSTATLAAPAALNKKRIAKGKLPFVEYKVLTVNGVHSSVPPQGGHHASPRQHLRRGHIRRIYGNRTVWVNQCLVGNPNKGFIVKDYRVKA